MTAIPTAAAVAHAVALTGNVTLTLWPAAGVSVVALALVGMGYGLISGITAAGVGAYGKRSLYGRIASRISLAWSASFDLHFAVNARASWLLVREFGRRFRTTHGRGRIIALTSDHAAGNLPYGASGGALDRIVLAAAREFQALAIAANVVNPGPTDTGWMTAQQMEDVSRQTPGGRVGLPADCASLVRFLCSVEGGWINGQLLCSNGGLR